MTWARNHGDSCRAGYADTKRAKKLTKVCPDCGTGIPNIKKRCATCAEIVAHANRNKNSLAHYRRKKLAQNGGGA